MQYFPYSVPCRRNGTIMILTIPAVTIHVNLGFKGACRDAIAQESIPTLSATGEEKKGDPKVGVIVFVTAVHDVVQ
jgi:hypothetical protein